MALIVFRPRVRDGVMRERSVYGAGRNDGRRDRTLGVLIGHANFAGILVIALGSGGPVDVSDLAKEEARHWVAIRRKMT
jgi:hypothetical protein